MVRIKLLPLVLIPLFVISAFAAQPGTPVKTNASPAKTDSPGVPAVRWYDSYRDALNMARFQNKPLLVDFTAKWCLWCDKMDKEVFANEKVISGLQDFVCVKVDIDKDLQTAAAYSVKSLPRVVVVNTHLEIVGDWLGFREPDDFSKLLNDVMEYANKKTGATGAPKIAAAGVGPPKPAQSVMNIKLDLADSRAVIEYLANPNPALRKTVIEKLAKTPSEAKAIAFAGLDSRYLGIRIASLELLRKIINEKIDFDPWAKKEKRTAQLKALNKTPRKKPGK